MRRIRGAGRRLPLLAPLSPLLPAVLCALALAPAAQAQPGAAPPAGDVAAPAPEVPAAQPVPAEPVAQDAAPEPSTAEAPRKRSGPPPYTVRIIAPGAVRPLLEEYLDLTRFRDAPGLADITEGELGRLMSETPAQVRSLLETEGYFTPDIRVERTPGPPPLVRVIVEPGPRTVVNRVTLEVQGPVQEAAAEGQPHAGELLEAIEEGWPLPPGEPFRQSEWTGAKAWVISQLRSEGYPTASWSGTAAEIFAPQSKARLFVVADSGPLYRFGPVQVEGLELYREEAVVNLRGFDEGDIYRERLLLDYQERLQRSDLFQAATVVLDTSTETPQAAPVRVRVRERLLREATLSVGYSDATGPRVGIEHTHRRVFGWHWIARSRAQIGQELTRLESELISHPKPRLYRNLVSAAVNHFEGEESARTTEWRLRAGRRQETDALERLYYAEYTGSVLRTPVGDVTAQALLGNYQWIRRRLDSIVLPTDGYSVSAQAGAGYAHSNSGGSGPFGRLVGRLLWYEPVGSWYATARVEAGQVLAKDEVGVPESLLFRVGGDESVRGYAHRSIGPRVGGVVVGGRVFTTASAEIARPITQRFPELWGAAFVDAGDAANAWGEIDPLLGYGIGLRWRSPVGPLRADLAYGQEEKQLRLHISVGIAF